MKKYVSPKRDSLARLVISVAVVTTFVFWPLSNRVQANDGDLDLTFGSDGKVVTDFGADDGIVTVLVQKDGKILAVGFTTSTGGGDFAVARYNNDGSPDTTWGTDGKVTTDFFAENDLPVGAFLQADGKLIVGGRAYMFPRYRFALARFNLDGSLDQSFGQSGKVTTQVFDEEVAFDITLQPDGKIIAIGNGSLNGTVGNVLARYNTDGSLDTSFGSSGKVLSAPPDKLIQPSAVTLQPGNKIVIAGWGGFNVSPSIDFALKRFNSDGSLDGTFGVDGLVATDFTGDEDIAYDVATQPDGKIVAVGRANNRIPFSVHSVLARYNNDGTLDTTFGSGGKVISPLDSSYDVAFTVAIQVDGKIITGGHTASGLLLVARYNVNGSLDNSFASGGYTTMAFSDLNYSYVRSVSVQSDGKILGAGGVFTSGPYTDFGLVRFDGRTFDLCLQDDSSGNLLQINTTTGEYQFTNCSGFTLSGTGSIVRKGGTITLQHNGGDRRVTAKIDLAVNKAAASIQMLSQGTTFSVTDRNTANNTCTCR